MSNPIDVEKAQHQADQETKALGGPGPERLNAAKYRDPGATESATASQRRSWLERNIGEMVARVNEARTNVSLIIADMVILLAEWLRDHQPSNKEIAALLTGSDREEPSRVRVVKMASRQAVSANEGGRVLEQANKRPVMAYKQYATKYRFLADVTNAIQSSDFKKWGETMILTPKQIIADGVKIDGHVYHSPADALRGQHDRGGQPNTLTAVVQAYRNLLKPSELDLSKFSPQWVTAARLAAEKVKVTVRTFDKATNRDNVRRGIVVASNSGTLLGFIQGLVEAARANKVGLNEKQITTLSDALMTLGKGSVTETPDEE